MNWVLRLIGILSIMVATLEPATAADSDPAAVLAERKGCLQCHDMDRMRIGPAFVSIADRYRSDPEAEARLVDWLEGGGRRHWGDDYAMPKQSRLRPGEAQTLVRWVLGR